jgi:hypothetical protein
MKSTSPTKRLTIESVDFDHEDEMDEFNNQMVAAGLEKVRAESAKLIRRGLMDEEGHIGLLNPSMYSSPATST